MFEVVVRLRGNAFVAFGLPGLFVLGGVVVVVVACETRRFIFVCRHASDRWLDARGG